MNDKNKKIFWGSLIIVFVLLTSILVYLNFTSTKQENLGNSNTSSNSSSSFQTLTLSNGSLRKKLDIEIADTPEDQAKGLMFRKELSENYGMLFLFPDESERTFWMKDTYVALDMIFFDQNKNFVSVQKNAEPCLDRGFLCPSYLSNGKAKYVLEVKAGSVDENLLQNGLKFEY